ncbi:DUF3857 and transglutaminase domain-containing protein [Allomuricauda sp. d1]|uniref:DUF3857 domain-containing transglutaminase family protein n=1 Tax=Allomuricauda sp. d1 TaxID=3136725 RepID=UPI0031D11F0F
MRFFTLLLTVIVYGQLLSQELALNYGSIPPQLLENADAIVRLDEKEVVIDSYRSMKVTHNRIVTVLNESGKKYIHAYAFYDNEIKISGLSVIVYDAKGKEIDKFKERDFLDQSATGSSTLYSDSRVKYLRYTPIEYPYTVVFSKSYLSSDTAFIPSGNFLDGYRVSTKKSSYTLSVNCDVPFRHKEEHLKEFGVQSKKMPKKFHYYAENLKAVEKEPYAYGFRDFAPQVKFVLEKFHLKGVDGKAKNWKEFGKWIYESLLVDQDILNEAAKANARKLVWGVKNPVEKVKKVYEYVQNNTRYVSVQLGIGGWKPISAQEVDNVKYGDCKGLTNYTKALLKEVGIDSYYTIVYGDTQKRDLDPDFPALQGNHVFLNVPLENESIWLECTDQQVPVNYLGTFTDDRYVLKVTPNGGELVKSKKYSEQDSRQSTSASISIDRLGKISAEVNIISTGVQYNQKYRLVNQTYQEQEEHYKDHWDYVNNMQIDDIDIVNDRDTIALQEKIAVSTENYVSFAGENWLFTPNMFNRNLYVPKRVRDRNREVVVQRGYMDKDDFVIKLPEGYRIEALLSAVDILTDFGEYQINMEKISETEYRYSRRLLLKAGKYPKERYDEFRDFKKKIARNDNSKIILTKT